jgi:1-acyl-sn-glycerol-3-phosphate acyltransferase
MGRIVTLLKLTFGIVMVAIGATIQSIICLLLLPSRIWRIRSCVFVEKFVGWGGLWITGCSVKVTGREHLDRKRPAIYLVNHTSMVDLFVAMVLMPLGAVGIVKKEVIYYPFFGQMYLLTGHLRLDRSNREAAVASMKSLAELVHRGGLSIFIAPEGTRSRSGRLLPFKKGFVHLARQTGLPVVPIVVKGAFKSWVKHSFSIRGVQVEVEVLPAISSEGWDERAPSDIVSEIEQVFCAHLPDDQIPITE